MEEIAGPLSLSANSPHTESVWNSLTRAITTPMWSVTLLASDLRMQRLNEAATEWYVKLEIPLARLGGDFPSVRAVHVTIAYNVRLLAWAEFEQWEAFHASLLSNLPATSTLLLEPSETDGVFFVSFRCQLYTICHLLRATLVSVARGQLGHDARDRNLVFHMAWPREE